MKIKIFYLCRSHHNYHINNKLRRYEELLDINNKSNCIKFHIEALDVDAHSASKHIVHPDAFSYIRSNSKDCEFYDYITIQSIESNFLSSIKFDDTFHSILLTNPSFVRIQNEPTHQGISFNKNFFDNMRISDVFNISNYIIKSSLIQDLKEDHYWVDIFRANNSAISYTFFTDVADYLPPHDPYIIALLSDYFLGTKPWVRDGFYILDFLNPESLKQLGRIKSLSILKHLLYTFASYINYCLDQSNDKPLITDYIYNFCEKFSMIAIKYPEFNKVCNFLDTIEKLVISRGNTFQIFGRNPYSVLSPSSSLSAISWIDTELINQIDNLSRNAIQTSLNDLCFLTNQLEE